MEACVIICRANKPKARKCRILFINAVNAVTRERAQSFLTDDHIEQIVKAYSKFKDEPGFAHVATLEEIRAKDANLSIPLYVSNGTSETEETDAAKSNLPDDLAAWLESSRQVHAALDSILERRP
jgi:type I restriction enzyme M protein